MKRLCEIMEDIRGMPVCPKTGEENLYYVIAGYSSKMNETKRYTGKSIRNEKK